MAYSGEVLVTKDEGCMRLWRAGGDCALLRVVSCPGRHVAFHTNGQYIVTGTRGAGGTDGGVQPKVWGAAGGTAASAGKADILRNKTT